MFVFIPIAAIAMIIKNLLNSFRGVVITGERLNTVVITAAKTKYKIKNGNIFLRLTFPPSAFSSFLVLTKASTNVMGIIARVLVSFTIVAASNVLLICIPSHAAAAAVTDDVSFIAVPANKPNPSLDNPRNAPSAGNINAAITLNKNITDIA